MPFEIFAYFGPETVMPVTSVIATVAAFVMMFGRLVLRSTLGWLYLWKAARAPRQTAGSAPHFSMQHRQGDTVARSGEHGQQHASSLRY
jgi:hypothetical protein